MARRRGTALFAVAIALAAVTVAGCGRDDFENEPRPPLPTDVSVELGEDAVVVSPAEFGAGIATLTIANLGPVPASLAIDGPSAAESEEIAPGDTAVLKAELVTGEYEAGVVGTDVEPFLFDVGPERDSAQNELLLP